MFGAGTACVVCPVKSINFLDEVSNMYHKLPHYSDHVK